MQHLSSGFRNVKNFTASLGHKQTPLEKNLKDATSNAKWGTANTILHEISRSSHEYADYHIIMSAIWDAVQERGKNWRRVFKALTLLEYLVKNGSERVIEELRDAQYKIRQLQDFSHIEDGKDWGAGIKEKTSIIIGLINDPEALQTERETAKRNRDKFVGMGNDMSGTGGGGEYDSFGSDSKRYSSFPKRYDSPQEKKGGLASRLDRDIDKPSSKNDDDRIKRRFSDKRAAPRKQKESSSSSDSDSSDKKVKAPQAPINLLDMGEPAFGGFESAKVDPFHGFTSASSAPAPSSFDPFAPTQGGFTDAGFGDFVGASVQKQNSQPFGSAGMNDLFSSSAQFNAQQSTLQQPQQHQQLQQQQLRQQQLQQQQLQQQQLQRQQQEQLQRQQQEQLQRQQQEQLQRQQQEQLQRQQQEQMQRQQQEQLQRQQQEQMQEQMQQRMIQQAQQRVMQQQLAQQQARQPTGFLNDVASHLYELPMSDQAAQPQASNMWANQSASFSSSASQQPMGMNTGQQQQSMGMQSQAANQMAQASMAQMQPGGMGMQTSPSMGQYGSYTQGMPMSGTQSQPNYTGAQNAMTSHNPFSF